MTDLREHVPLGATGMKVSRLGIASGFGVPTAAIEKAFHEHGINYFWLSFARRGRMVRAIRNLRRHRDELCIVLPWPAAASRFVQGRAERWLRKTASWCPWVYRSAIGHA